MHQMNNDNIAISISENSIVITDKKRGVDWKLNGNGLLSFDYALRDDYIEVKYVCKDDNLQSVTMPSSFSPSGTYTDRSQSKKYLFPMRQGMLWDTNDSQFSQTFEFGYPGYSHDAFGMPFFAILGDKGGLLHIAETCDDCTWAISRSEDGKTHFDNIQNQSLGSMRYDRVIRIYFTDPTITAAKQYKKYVIEQGRFISFKEKIKTCPSMEKSFGALMCFIGYCQDDIDYVENFRRLKEYGFDRALVYPVRFNTYTLDFKMGGQPPVNLSDGEIDGIKELGYDVAPWTHIGEALF